MTTRTTRRLTKSIIDALKPKAEPYVVYDTDITGLSIRVAPSGQKTWRVDYRVAPGGRGAPVKRFALGPATAITAENARRDALAVRADAARGIDHAAEKMARRRELTVGALIDLYEAEGCYVLKGPRQGKPMKPETRKHVLAVLQHHVQPTIGPRKLSDVNVADIERLQRAVINGKTGKQRQPGQVGRHAQGGEGSGVKTIRVVSAMFEFAIRRDLMADNPCRLANVRRGDNRRERFLTLTEIGALGTAMAELEAIAAINLKAAAIVRLLLMTGARRREINNLRWSEVDLKHSRLVLADTKTGKSVRPLASPAAALLASLTPMPGSLYVFPSADGERPFGGLQKNWQRIVAKAGLTDVSLHTLRHSVGSAAVSGGATLPMVGAILGHGDHRSTEIYAHLQREPALQAADRAIAPIAAALEGKPLAEVVPLRK